MLRALLLEKKTSSVPQRESLQGLEQRGVLPATYRQDIELADREHAATLQEAHAILAKAGYEVTEFRQQETWPTTKFDLIVTLGGDGTVLNASHFLPDNNITIAAIRSSHRSVGKLCAFDHRQLKHFATWLQAGSKAQRLELRRLCAEITCNQTDSKKLSQPVLNDFLYTNSNPAAMTHYSIRFAKHWASQKSSGVWVATAAGSSAALQAAGGKATDFGSGVFQFKVRELYHSSGNYIDGCPFDLQHNKLTICSLCEQALLALDGHHHVLPLQYGDTIDFKPAPPISIAWL